MSITASMVKELRERTGAGMMECKKALVAADGNIEAAAEEMRKSGLAKADKKAGRVAAEGLIAVSFSADKKQAAMVEINSETDFVSKADDFKAFVAAVADTVLASKVEDAEALSGQAMADGTSIDDARRALIAKIGENVQVRRAKYFETTAGHLAAYLHGSRIGVMVELEGGDEALAKDVAMHVAASKPICIDADGVPAEVLQKEREIQIAQAEGSGKPANIIEKMVDGRMKKYLSEITLLGQAFVKDPDQSVEKLLAGASAKVNDFLRFEVGEGIEKKTENFAEEVMAQARGE